MSHTLWLDRVGEKLKGLPRYTYLECSRDSGIEFASSAHGFNSKPTIRLWFDAVADEAQVVQELSIETTRVFGSKLLVPNSSLKIALKALAEYQVWVEPVQFVVGWAEYCLPLIEEILSTDLKSSRVLAVGSKQAENRVPEPLERRESSFLKLNHAEALYEARGALPDTEIERLLRRTSGNFKAFRSEVATILGLKDFQLTALDGSAWPEHVRLSGVLDVLQQRGQLVYGFELACAYEPDRVHEFINAAGNHFFNRGAYEYLWRRLSSLPLRVRKSDEVAYWLVATGMATNRRRETHQLAVRVMAASDAPEVRASTAVAMTSANMLEETAAALKKARTITTLRARGFALAWAGERERPIELFREALKLAEDQIADHAVVACGFDIAELLIRQGLYKSATEWSEWALGEYHRRGLKDELRRASGAAIFAYASLLSGGADDAQSLQSKVQPEARYLGVPGYEAVYSTAGDIAFVSGDFERAQREYQLIHEHTTIDSFCFTGLNVLNALLAKREIGEARALAEQAAAICNGSSSYESALSELMLGMVHTYSGMEEAERHLLSALEGFSDTTAEVHIAQCAVWLAKARMDRGRRKDAILALRLGRKGLAELGSAGWRLVSVVPEVASMMRSLWREAQGRVAIKFLGNKSLVVEKEAVTLGLRAAEIITILAIHSQGLSGDRLHAYLYGDRQVTMSTLKASISRLRKIVPISLSPYRLEVPYQADFLQMLELLNSGDLQRALHLYTGPLLPKSESPLIEEWRDHISEALREAVITARDPEQLIQLGTILNNDLEVWEVAREVIPLSDFRRPVITARIRRIRATWGV